VGGRRSWAAWVSIASLVGLAVYASLTLATLQPGDRTIFGLGGLDARPLYGLVAVLAVAAIGHPASRPAWLVVMSIATIGRAASLLVLGSPELTRRAEVRASVGWLLLWLLGILAVLVLEATAVIRTVTKEGR